MTDVIDYIGSLDVGAPAIPTLYTDKPVRLICTNHKPLNVAIERMQATLNDMKARYMTHNYQQKADEFKRDVKTIRGRAVQAYHQYIPPNLRVTFWIVFGFVCLLVAGFIKAVTPF